MLKPDLIDLDQLEYECKYPKSKVLLLEAIGCYRAGSYRAAISTVWLAIVVDYVSKLEELAEKQHADAKSLVASFYDWQSRRDSELSNLLLFEKQILENARDKFQFIDPLEYDDLKRLYEDRNKCAHPSMNGNELYTPSAELARFYLRRSVETMLMHRATLGRAAIAEIWSEVKSFTFPASAVDAERVLRNGPLGHGVRGSVYKEIAEGLMTSVLKEQHSSEDLLRRLSALAALDRINTECVKNAFSLKLDAKVRSLSDDDRLKVIPLLRAMPESWHSISNDERSKIEQTLSRANPEMELETVTSAIYVEGLRPTAMKILMTSPPSQLSEVIANNQHSSFLDLSIERLSKSSSFDDSTQIMYLLVLPFQDRFTDSQLRQIVRAMHENPQIFGAEYNVHVHVKNFLNATQGRFSIVRDEWIKLKDKVMHNQPNHIGWSEIASQIEGF